MSRIETRLPAPLAFPAASTLIRLSAKRHNVVDSILSVALVMSEAK